LRVAESERGMWREAVGGGKGGLLSPFARHDLLEKDGCQTDEKGETVHRDNWRTSAEKGAYLEGHRD
jgi:hypothetical protein